MEQLEEVVSGINNDEVIEKIKELFDTEGIEYSVLNEYELLVKKKKKDIKKIFSKLDIPPSVLKLLVNMYETGKTTCIRLIYK